MTAALSEAVTPSQVAAVVVDQGVAALGALAGSMVLLAADGAALEIVRAIGYAEEMLDSWRRFPISAPTPLSDAVQTATPVWLESLAVCERRYPVLAAAQGTGAQAWAAIPLLAAGRAVGAIGLSFAEPQVFGDDDRAFMLALARQCALALERARLYEAERTARAQAEATQRRLALLARASRILADSLDYETTLQNVARLAVPALADLCFVDIVQDDGSTRRLALAHADPEKEALAQAWPGYHPAADVARLAETSTGVPKAIRSGQSEITSITPDRVQDVFPLVAATGNPEYLRLIRQLQPRSRMIVPLVAHGRTLGAISFYATESGRQYGSADLAFAEDVASRCALAIEHARLYREAQEAIGTREAERDRLRQVLAVLPEGIVLADALGRVVVSNAAAQAIWGQPFPATDTRGGGEYDGAHLHLDGTPYRRADVPLARAIERGETVRGEQLLVRNALTNQLVPLLVSSAPLRHASGTIVG
ncbi:MAG: GAF domain-containing protein, partial [Chloroflexota bacterium]